MNDYLGALSTGHDIAGESPILLVNEPMYIATGLHSDIRYNDFYPRWAYDHYRAVLVEQAKEHSWNFLDLWDTIPGGYFSDTPLHLNAEGERLLLEQILRSGLSAVCH